MYNQPEEALEKYNIEIDRVVKGRGRYMCETKGEIRVLSPFGGSEERARVIKELLVFIQNNGMKVEQVYETAEETVLAMDESGNKYWLKDCFKGEECNPCDENQLRNTIERLADLHNITMQYKTQMPENLCVNKTNIYEVYARRGKELNKLRNYVRTKNKKNEFELKFQNNIMHFDDMAKSAIENLKELSGSEQMLWCHGNVNHHNFLFEEENVYLVNFESAFLGYYEVELASYLRKILEKNNWSYEVGKELIELYNNRRKMTEDSLRRIYFLLLFPEKFWKVANHYGNSKKVGLMERDLEKLNKVLLQEKDRNYFLERLFEFIF